MCKPLPAEEFRRDIRKSFAEATLISCAFSTEMPEDVRLHLLKSAIKLHPEISIVSKRSLFIGKRDEERLANQL